MSKQLNKGFTLLEILVVLTIMAIVTASTLLFLTNTFKGSNQATVTSEVKQNGQAVLDSLERQIRGGKDAAAVGTDNTQIRIDLPDNTNSLFIKCFLVSSSNPAVNGWIGVATKPTGQNPSDSDFVRVTNDNPNSPGSGVDVGSCTLAASPTVTSPRFAPAVVFITFTLDQGQGAPSRQDFKANVQYETTISLRNYQ